MAFFVPPLLLLFPIVFSSLSSVLCLPSTLVFVKTETPWKAYAAFRHRFSLLPDQLEWSATRILFFLASSTHYWLSSFWGIWI